MNAFNEAVRLLPPRLAAALGQMAENAEEFRLRTGFAPTALIFGTEVKLSDAPVTSADIECLLEKATNASVHTAQADMAKGFIPCRFGIRLGLCGTGIVTGGRVAGLRDISSVSVRIPHEVYGCGGDVLDTLCRERNANVLILSPPGGGKTTFLRECIRVLSNAGTRVAVADERGELAAMHRGAAQFDIGEHTDVLTDIPKAEAVIMLLRAMNPQVVVMDEISSPADCAAVSTAIGCGVRVIATAHAGSVNELHKRPAYKTLLELKAFSNAVIISNRAGVRSYSWEALA